ncbi:MAG: Na+/H+ antiporter subunit C [Candidatus Omnitrophica bacterium]|nr:Na+/H+ antiporter subunit C [Candidatus Omnitrophota bacterium]
MEGMLAVVVGVLYAASFYLLLRPSMVKLIIGLGLLSHAANLLLFTVGRVTRVNPPIAPVGALAPVEPFANPLPQALILTAIVISFGVLAFAMVLLYRSYQMSGTDNLNEMRRTDS